MSEKLTVSLLMRLIDKISGPAENISRKLKNLRHAAAISATGLRQYKEKADKAFEQAGNMSLAAEGFSRVADKINGLTSAPIEKAKDLQVAITRLGVSAAEDADKFQELNNQVIAASAGTTFTATEIAASTRLLKRAGMDTETAIGKMPAVAQYAEAHQLDLAQATEQVAGVMRGFQLPAGQVVHATDLITAAARAGNMGVEEFAGELASIAPTANALEVSMDTAASTMALLGKAGITGERGASALHAVIQRLAAPRSLKRSTQVLNMIGVQALDAHKNLRPVPELLGEIAKKTAGMGTAMKQRSFTALFGREGAIAMADFFKALKPEDIPKFIEEMTKAAGVTKQLADALGVTAKEGDDRFSASLTNLGAALGGPLLPTLSWFKNTITHLVIGITRWTAKHPGLTKALMGSALAIGAVATGLAGLVTLMSATRTLRGVMYLATGYSKFGFALAKLASAPMGSIAKSIWGMTTGAATSIAVLLAFAAAITAVYLAVDELQKHWKDLDFGQAAKGMWESVKEQGPLATLGDLVDPTAYAVEHGWMEKPKEGSKSGGARWLNTPKQVSEMNGKLQIQIDNNTGTKVNARVVSAAGVNIDMVTGRMMTTP